ncbi:MAG: NUDIX hydrolase [Propionibacteriaceae bacterium]|nr:NUDIX hydrolase [Propionibacteriaceae bacterium]
MKLVDEPLEWPWERAATTHGVLMDFVTDRVAAPDGTWMVRNYMDHPNSVGILALDDQGRIAIEHQYRHPVRHRLVEAPAGLCDLADEDLATTAKRELAEELGLAGEHWSVLVDMFATPGSSTQRSRIFLARGLTTVPRPEGFQLEGEEADMEVGWADLDDLVDAIFAGDVNNPVLVAGVLALKVAQSTGLDRLRPA